MSTFQEGQIIEIQGVRLRVREGRKWPGDQIIDIETGAGWLPLPMTLGFVMADFFYSNEERGYPPALGFKGGTMYLDFLFKAARVGWEVAETELRRMRSNRDERNGSEL